MSKVEPEYVDATAVCSMFKPPLSKPTLAAWVAQGKISAPIQLGNGKRYFSIKTLREELANATRPAKPEPPAEPSVTVVDTRPEAIALAVAVATTGALPANTRADWRNLFSWAQSKRDLPANLVAAFGLQEHCDLYDLADAVERRLNPPKADPRNAMHGWSEGVAPTQLGAERAERVMAEQRKGGRR